MPVWQDTHTQDSRVAKYTVIQANMSGDRWLLCFILYNRLYVVMLLLYFTIIQPNAFFLSWKKWGKDFVTGLDCHGRLTWSHDENGIFFARRKICTAMYVSCHRLCDVQCPLSGAKRVFDFFPPEQMNVHFVTLVLYVTAVLTWNVRWVAL